MTADPHETVERLKAIYRSELLEAPTEEEMLRANTAIDVLLTFMEELQRETHAAAREHDRQARRTLVLVGIWGLVGWLSYLLDLLGVLP